MKKVWVNGCFDILHYGHFRLLDYAASIGNLTVGIDSDKRVKELKGKDRPFHTAEQRKYNLCRINDIQKVVIFNNEDELVWNIKNEQTDVMVIGSDYKNKRIVGAEFISTIHYFDLIEGISTTNIMNYGQ